MPLLCHRDTGCNASGSSGGRTWPPCHGQCTAADPAAPTAVVPVRGPEVIAGDAMTSKDVGGATGGDSSSATVMSLPFILSESLAPVLAKLVARIYRDEFVDMADLLRDNLEARRQGDLPEAMSSSMEPKCSRREVPDLLSWVQCDLDEWAYYPERCLVVNKASSWACYWLYMFCAFSYYGDAVE